MNEKRNYLRQFGGISLKRVYLWILILNVIVFEIQGYQDSRFFRQFALSAFGLKQGMWHQLFTFQFLHGGVVHLLMNSVAIFVFGPIVEKVLGKIRFLILYFTCGALGGLAQAGFYWMIERNLGMHLVGASAGAFGLVAAFACFFPREKLILLLFFVFPVVLQAKTVLASLIGLSFIFFLFPAWGKILGMGSNVAHLAHLGGIIGGLWLGHILVGEKRLQAIEKASMASGTWNREFIRRL